MSELDSLLRRLGADREWERHRALGALKANGAPADVVRAMAGALASDDAARRNGARAALAALAHPACPAAGDARPVLEEALQADDPDIRILAASAMGESENPDLVPTLVAALGDQDPNVAAAAADALGQLGHPDAVGPLSAVVPSPSFWVNMAAVVALGRLRDPRAIPALRRVATEPGLAAATAEASRRINDPDALPLLEAVRAQAGEEALLAAGAILSSHPELQAPDWVVEAAREQEESLVHRLVADDDPAAGRLLGLAATDTAIEALLTLAAPPRQSEAALAGLLASPPRTRTGRILDRIEGADPDHAAALLGLLPPLHDDAHVDRLVPLLGHPSVHVRAAAAEALARSPVERALPALADALAGPPVRPEVVRALGSLGAKACMALIPLLEDPAPPVRAAAADALSRCAGADVEEDVRAALAAESDSAARSALLRALAVVAGPGAMPDLRVALEDDDPEIHAAAIEALGATGSPDAVPLLGERLRETGYPRLAAIRALGELEQASAVPFLAPVLRSSDLEARRLAARALGPLAEEVPMDTVLAMARDSDPRIRAWAVRMLAARGAGGHDQLHTMAERDPDAAVRAEAFHALAPDG